MAIDKMATQLIAELERQFEVEPAALPPVAEVGLGQTLAGNFHREPVLALVDHGQATARAGNRRANGDRRHVVPGADNEAAVSRLAARSDGGDLADIGDDAGEHVRT